jgi:hypothetical protein
MIASAHIAAGVASGMAAAHLVQRPVPRAAMAFASGVLTHVLLDALPHGDYGELERAPVLAIVIAELITAGIALTRILRHRLTTGWPVSLMAGLAGAALPDLKFVAAFVLSPGGAAAVAAIGDGFHQPFHAGPSPLGVGVTIEVVATLVIVALLTRFPLTRPTTTA